MIKLKAYNSDNILTPSSGAPTGEYIILVDKEEPSETLYDGKWEYSIGGKSYLFDRKELETYLADDYGFDNLDEFLDTYTYDDTDYLADELNARLIN